MIKKCYGVDIDKQREAYLVGSYIHYSGKEDVALCLIDFNGIYNV